MSAMTIAGMIDAAERRPLRPCRVPRVHALVWTALPSLLYFNLPLDVIEAMTYGREWQLGYDKLPPLPWWLAEIAYRLTGVDASLYALAQAAVIVAFIAVWMTARPIVGAAGALAALLIIDGMHYFNLQRRQVQSQRRRDAVLGARRLRFSCRAAARKAALLDSARRRAWARLVGEIFRGDPGGAAGAVLAVRSGRPPPIGATGPLDRAPLSLSS